MIVRPPADAAKRAALDAAVASARAHGASLEVRITRAAGDAKRLAAAAARSGAPLVVAAGGDGTVHEVVNGLLVVETPPRLGVIPFGTANDFATALGLPPSPSAALDVALTGEAEALDVAKVNDRYFINVSTGGFGADATKSAARGVKRLLGPLAYLASGAVRLLGMRGHDARFECDGEVLHDGAFTFFAVGNSRTTGGGAQVTPRADLDDRRLDVMVLRGASRLDLLSLLPDLRAGSHLDSPDVLYIRAGTLDVLPAGALPVNADGERVAGERFAYRVSGRQLHIMLPPGHAPL